MSDYQEFVETGVHERLGYLSPADVADHYPQFYLSRVEPYIGDALRYLDMTMEGKQWTATLYSHIFAIEHNRWHTGPQPGPALLHHAEGHDPHHPARPPPARDANVEIKPR